MRLLPPCMGVAAGRADVYGAGPDRLPWASKIPVDRAGAGFPGVPFARGADTTPGTGPGGVDTLFGPAGMLIMLPPVPGAFGALDGTMVCGRSMRTDAEDPAFGGPSPIVKL